MLSRRIGTMKPAAMKHIERRRIGILGEADRSCRRLVASASLAMLTALAWGTAAQAATVTALQGHVLVSSGGGYRLVDGAIQVGPGGTVVANPGAVARVAYGGGCDVTVQPGSVYNIAPQSPCSEGNRDQPRGFGDKTQVAAAPVIGGIGGGAAASAGAAAGSAAAASTAAASTAAATAGASTAAVAGTAASINPWLIGAGAAAVGGGAAYYAMSISP